MGWDKGKYYTKSFRRNGKVCRLYVGTGETAALAAGFDAAERKIREAERMRWRSMAAELDDLDAKVAAVAEFGELAASVSLIAAGYHKHKRFQWRRRRVRKE